MAQVSMSPLPLRLQGAPIILLVTRARLIPRTHRRKDGMVDPEWDLVREVEYLES